jgi:hypothetical protein
MATVTRRQWRMSDYERRLARYRLRVFTERSRLAAALADARDHQRAVLADLLAYNANTEFGIAHGFAAIRTLNDFRKAVPVQDYAAVSPFVERMVAGERNVLTADQPVVFVTSSGSTGAPKTVPVTARFLRSGFFPFCYTVWAPLAEHFPDALADPDAILNLQHDPPAAVVPRQFDFGEPLSAEPGTSARWATLPASVPEDDHLERTYQRLRLAVESDVRGVIGINPAMVTALPYQLTQWWPRIVREVCDGTVGGVPCRPPNPERAATLDRLADYFGAVRPSQVWPNLRVICCWTGGVASLYLPRLREEFGTGVTVLPAPVAGSEGPIGVALDRHGSAGTLVVTAAAYEFAEADGDLGPDVPTLEPHELEPGRDYHVIFSHVGGLYRYAAGDVVRVVDMDRGVPRVAHAGRDTRLDAAGERLREAQVISALVSALDSGGLELRNVSCRVTAPPGGPARYEFAVATGSPWSAAEVTAFGGALDTALGVRAPGYRRARHAELLGVPVIRRLDAAAFHRDWHDAVSRGSRPTHVRDHLFRQDAALWHRLTGDQV